jgi:sialic acid synthase SpsE
MKKPGTGIPYKFKHKVIGKKASRDISSNKLLKLRDLL